MIRKENNCNTNLKCHPSWLGNKENCQFYIRFGSCTFYEKELY